MRLIKGYCTMNATDKAEMAHQQNDMYATLNEDGSFTLVDAEEELFDLREEEDGL